MSQTANSESLRSMAGTLGQSPSTIIREFKHNEAPASAGTGGSSTSIYYATASSA